MGRQLSVRHRCPSCGSVAVRRSSRRDSDRYALHVMRSPYRCRDCGNRFWAVSTRAWSVMFGAALVVAGALAWNALWEMYDQFSSATENVERFDSMPINPPANQ